MVRKALVIAAMLLATPALAGDGPVVAYFTDEPAAVSDKLAGMCIAKGIMVDSQSDRQVQCSQEMDGLGGVFAQALIGNSYSTTPRQVVRFQISRVNGATVVQGVQWIETQMAYGQVRREELDGKKHRRTLLGAMVSIGGMESPPQTTATK